MAWGVREDNFVRAVSFEKQPELSNGRYLLQIAQDSRPICFSSAHLVYIKESVTGLGSSRRYLRQRCKFQEAAGT